MANDRIFYPMQQLSFRKCGAAGAEASYYAPRGIQNVGMSLDFNLENVFELGQLAIYERVEGVPSVELTTNKVLDGDIPVYLLGTAAQGDGTNTLDPNLLNRAKGEVIAQLGIFDETQVSTSGFAPNRYVEMSGLVVSNVSYTFGVDGNFTEDVTLIGENRVWDASENVLSCSAPWPTYSKSGFDHFDNSDVPVAAEGVNARENLKIGQASANDADLSTFPTGIAGVENDGDITVGGAVHIQSITTSVDFGREDLFQLGQRRRFKKITTFPVEVTTEIEVISNSGDQISAIDQCDGCTDSTALNNEKIRLSTCEGLRIYLGDKNKLTSVSYGGGDAGGGNVTVTYSYSNFNDFTVLHSGDIFSDSGAGGAGTGWWNNRQDYLGASSQDAALDVDYPSAPAY